MVRQAVTNIENASAKVDGNCRPSVIGRLVLHVYQQNSPNSMVLRSFGPELSEHIVQVM